MAVSTQQGDFIIATTTTRRSVAGSVRYQHALKECHLREQPLQMLGKLGPHEAFAADLLKTRFLKRWSTSKTSQFLARKYDLGYLADRTFFRDQKQALWKFAGVCPQNLLVKKL